MENAMRPARRTLLAFAGSSAALIALPRFASALDYPTRAVHIVVGFAAGLSPDILGRLIAQALSERLNQQFIVDNKRLGSTYRSGRSQHWVKVKNPKAPAVKREAEEDWGRK